MEHKKIKVLFVINDLSVGGAQNMVAEEVGAMNADVFDPHLMTLLQYNSPDVLSKINLSSRKNVKFAFRGFFDPLSWFSAYRYLRVEKFDVVITNLFFANLVGRLLAIAAGVPVILSWEHNVYSDKKRWQIWVDRLLIRHTYRILVGAPQVKTFTLKQEGFSDKKIEVVYDAAKLTFVDIKNNRHDVLKKYDLPKNCTYIVGCGHLTEQKGHTHLIEAMRLLKDRRNGLGNIRCLIFGEGVLRDALSQQIRDGGLSEYVFLPGIAPIEDILAISDIFSLISLWEGFSIALIQAMNAGCAIVASRVSGSVDALEDGVNGLLVPPGDPVAAEAAFGRLIGDVVLAEKLGVAAKEASMHFDIGSHVERIEQIIFSGLRDSRGICAAP